jgi:hypothetical protein
MIGYRAWGLGNLANLTSHRSDQGFLWPVFHSHRPWLSGVNTAVHDSSWSSRLHVAPVASCICGIWIKPDPLDGLNYMGGDKTVISGAVQVWGRVIEHENGLRCQYAQVIALYGDHRHGDQRELIKLISERYDVPVFDAPNRLIEFASREEG